MTIPNGVEKIRSLTFWECYDLTKVTLPETLKEIEDGAFQESGIKEINIPSGVIKIPYGAFSRCYDLTKVIMPNTITEIGETAFYRCDALVNVNLPTSLTKIGTEAFAHSALTEIVIPSSVTEIGASAFYYCKFLKKVQLSSSMACIESKTFQDCEALKTVVIPSSVKTIGYEAFDGCPLTRIEIGEGIESIDTGAFGYSSDTYPNISIYIKALTPPQIKYNSFVFPWLATWYVPKESVDVYRSSLYTCYYDYDLLDTYVVGYY